jgi:hypothetical protein
VGAAAVILETGQRGQAERPVHLTGELAHRPGLATIRIQVEQAKSLAYGTLREEAAAH